MRHRKKSEKFSRSRAQKKALIKALTRAVIINERISTTTSKAKYLRGEVDKLITWAKKDTLACKRLAYRAIGDHKLVKRLFEVIGPRFKHINGGYTRILNMGYRKGDGAAISLFELTKKEVKVKDLKEKKGQAKIKPSKEKTQEVVSKKEHKIAPKKEAKAKAKKGIFSGVKKVFQKERDAL
jgi:large subunit ribosomal protein L17|tara:strand:- start:104 stop:649 length:546 start_codon:yes stop_codon:yes gene_type:complete